jgi:hypothetical protein
MLPSMLGLSMGVSQGCYNGSRWDRYQGVVLVVERVLYVLRAWEKFDSRYKALTVKSCCYRVQKVDE